MFRFLSIVFGLIITLSVSSIASTAMAATGLSDGPFTTLSRIA